MFFRQATGTSRKQSEIKHDSRIITDNLYKWPISKAIIK